MNYVPECRNFCIKNFLFIAEKHDFDAINKQHCRMLSNIFFKNKSHLVAPKSHKEAGLKVLKLT